jgi:hypothetical protein
MSPCEEPWSGGTCVSTRGPDFNIGIHGLKSKPLAKVRPLGPTALNRGAKIALETHKDDIRRVRIFPLVGSCPL